MGGSPSSREVPGSARPACSRRRGDCRLGGDASARRPRRRVRGRVCVRDRPPAVRAAARIRRSGSARRAALRAGRACRAAVRSRPSSPPRTPRPGRAPSRSFTACTGWPPTWPFSGRRCWRSTTCTGRTQPLCGGSEDLTRRLEGVPLLVAAATRPPEERATSHACRRASSPIRRAPRFASNRLAVTQSPCWAELHGLEPDEAFCAALHTATGGNPLFIGAVLDAVAREGTSPTTEQVPRLLEIGARGVSRAVGLRLARLPQPALALLRAASILGDGTSLRLAAALAAWTQASLVRPPPPSFGLTCFVVRIPSILPPRHPQRRPRDARCGRTRRRPPRGR